MSSVPPELPTPPHYSYKRPKRSKAIKVSRILAWLSVPFYFVAGEAGLLMLALQGAQKMADGRYILKGQPGIFSVSEIAVGLLPIAILASVVLGAFTIGLVYLITVMVGD